MTEEEKIIQIIPSDGWVAVYSNTGDELPEPEPVVCFALVAVTEHGETWTEVRAMVVDERSIIFCDSMRNFARVQYGKAPEGHA